MLHIVNGCAIATQDYQITFKENGLDELSFNLNRTDPAYQYLAEQEQILETTQKQRFTVRKISVSRNSVRVICQLALEDWQKDIFLNFSDLSKDGFTHERTESDMLQNILLASGTALATAGWTATVDIGQNDHKTRAISMAGPTPLDVVQQMASTFRCAFAFNTIEKKVKIFYPEKRQMTNVYAIETVNLLEAPAYKGDSSELFTRLYPVGKDGLSIADVNGGVSYVEDTSYTGGKVISKLWKDDRYESKTSLKADALEKLAEGCVPVKSWQLNIVDLHKLNPEAFPGLELKMFDKIRIIDRARKQSFDAQIREMKVYPYYPEKTVLTMATSTVTVQKTTKELSIALANPNSKFWQQLKSISI